jgi:hypothetical protein
MYRLNHPLLSPAPKYEGDNVSMEEGNFIKNRKRKYRCVKRPEIEDTEQSNDSSESTPSVRAMKRVTRQILAIPKIQGENMEMEKDDILGHKNMSKYYFGKTKNCVIL